MESTTVELTSPAQLTPQTPRDGREGNATLSPTVPTTTTTFFTGSPTAAVSTMETESTSTVLPTTVEYTTVIVDNFTASTHPPDCTAREFWCQNGGTCIFTSEGSKARILYRNEIV